MIFSARDVHVYQSCSWAWYSTFVLYLVLGFEVLGFAVEDAAGHAALLRAVHGDAGRHLGADGRDSAHRQACGRWVTGSFLPPFPFPPSGVSAPEGGSYPHETPPAPQCGGLNSAGPSNRP